MKTKKGRNISENSSFEKFLPYLLGIFVILLCITKINGEDDIFWHIETGKYIIENKTVPSTDVFSFATYGEKWIPFEWFWDVLAFSIFSFSGFIGLYVLTVIIVLLIFYLLFDILKKFRIDTSFSVILLFILAVGIKYRLGLKPHMFTYLFLVLTLYLIINYRYFNLNFKYLYFLPITFLFWANIHMGVLAGLLIVSVFIISELLAYFSKSKKVVKPDRKTLYKLFLTLILVTAAMLINPNFIETYTYTYEHTQMRLINEIFEWKSPFDSVYFGKLFNIIYILFLISVIYVIKYSFGKNYYFPALLTIVFAVYSLRAVRFTTDFLLVAFPFVVISLEDSFRNSLYSFFRNRKKLSAGMIFFVLILFIALTPGNTTYRIIGFNSDFGIGLYDETFPVKAFDFIKKTGISEIGERPFQTFDYGGYYLHNFPGKKNFIDSRNLNDSIYYKFLSIVQKKSNFNELISDYNFDYCILFFPLLSYDPQLMERTILSYLFTNSGWIPVYFDNIYFVFVRNEPKFENIINVHGYKSFSPYNLFFKKQLFEIIANENNNEMLNELNRLKVYEPDSFYIFAVSKMFPNYF